LHLAYLDESGTVSLSNTDRFIVVAVVAANHSSARAIENHIKRLRKTLRKKAMKASGGELKASEAIPRQIENLLRAIAAEDIAIVAVIMNKRDMRRRPDDPEDWYRNVVGVAVRHCVDRWPQLELVLDKRYTKKSLRDRLEEAIRTRIGDVDQADVTIEHADSKATPCLQVTDYVAWAIRRKYEVGEQKYHAMIESRIVDEVVIEAE
jgi:hypothetical protein